MEIDRGATEGVLWRTISRLEFFFDRAQGSREHVGGHTDKVHSKPGFGFIPSIEVF